MILDLIYNITVTISGIYTIYFYYKWMIKQLKK